jgi:hypothetical protein
MLRLGEKARVPIGSKCRRTLNIDDFAASAVVGPSARDSDRTRMVAESLKQRRPFILSFLNGGHFQSRTFGLLRFGAPDARIKSGPKVGVDL